jgi:membrane protease YdiL (CAAX protease family)
VPIAAPAEAAFLALYLWWAAGGGPPQRTQSVRALYFRRRSLSPSEWFWGLAAAFFFAITVHAAIVFPFRLVPYPVLAFRRGYDFSFIPTIPLRWIAVVVSAASAGICEETGFRGYMQRPIERRHGAFVAILVSSVLFTLVHLTKGWATIGMVPIVLGAGFLLGILARASASLVPCMIGHTLMDIGLFAYWWTGIAGTFSARPLSETGPDRAFALTCVILAASLAATLFAIAGIRRAHEYRPI